MWQYIFLISVLVKLTLAKVFSLVDISKGIYNHVMFIEII